VANDLDKLWGVRYGDIHQVLAVEETTRQLLTFSGTPPLTATIILRSNSATSCGRSAAAGPPGSHSPRRSSGRVASMTENSVPVGVTCSSRNPARARSSRYSVSVRSRPSRTSSQAGAHDRACSAWLIWAARPSGVSAVSVVLFRYGSRGTHARGRSRARPTRGARARNRSASGQQVASSSAGRPLWPVIVRPIRR
jgi:hypothetical protein